MGKQGKLLDKEIWLRVCLLGSEMVVVVRKMVQEVPRETIIPGMWVQRGLVVVVVVGW